MTPTLIDQLKLAIQVESGEVDQMEVQYRTKGHDGWTSPTSPSARGWVWRFEEYEYRRKPKPLECWVAQYGPGHYKLLWNKDSEPIARPSDCSEPTRMIKMREVTND